VEKFREFVEEEKTCFNLIHS